MTNFWSNIPFDIFEKILIHLASDDDFEEDEDKHTQLQDVLNVSAVCRTWREYTVSLKAVWANLAGAHRVSPAMTSIILTRAGNHPLIVISELTENGGTSSLTGHHWDAIRANFHRVQKFHLEFEGTPDNRSFREFLQLPAPSLTNLHLISNVYGSQIDLSTLFNGSAPRLQSFNIEDLQLSFVNTRGVPALQNVLRLRYYIHDVDHEDLMDGTYLGLLRNCPYVQELTLGDITFPSEEFENDETCYGPFEAMSPISLHRASVISVTGDLLGVTASLILLNIPPSCVYHLHFFVDENPRADRVTNAGPQTFTRLDRIWVGKKYPYMGVVLSMDHVTVYGCDYTGKPGNTLRMEMSYMTDHTGRIFERFGFCDFVGFLAYLSRQSHFREMAAGVRHLNVNFMPSVDFADGEPGVGIRDPTVSAPIA